MTVGALVQNFLFLLVLSSVRNAWNMNCFSVAIAMRSNSQVSTKKAGKNTTKKLVICSILETE